MNTLVPRALIDRLIEIGRDERFEDLFSIEALFPSARDGSFMRLHPDEWAGWAAELSGDDVECLIKSLTILERRPSFKAGSVSPVIWMFRVIDPTFQRSGLIDWVLANTENEYVPFGTSSLGAKSLSEYLQIKRHVADRSAERKAAERDRQTETREEKAMEASHRLFGAIRRRDEKAIRALLARGADATARDSAGMSALEHAEAAGLAHLFVGEERSSDAPG